MGSRRAGAKSGQVILDDDYCKFSKVLIISHSLVLYALLSDSFHSLTRGPRIHSSQQAFSNTHV